MFRVYSRLTPFCAVRCGSTVSVLMSALWNEYPAKNSFFGCSTEVCALKTAAPEKIRKVAISSFDIEGFSRCEFDRVTNGHHGQGEIVNQAPGVTRLLGRYFPCKMVRLCGSGRPDS